MKIAIIKKGIPTPSASQINMINLAQGFFDLEHYVEILSIEEFNDKLWKIRVGDVHRFFNVNKKIKFQYFKGGLLFYFRNFKVVRGVINFLTYFPKLYSLIEPEIKVSNYCIRNKFDLVICRDTFRIAYYNIINKIPTIIDLHGYKNIEEMEDLLKLRENPYFKGITALNKIIKQKLISFGFPKKKIFTMDNAINLKRFDKINTSKKALRKILNLPLNKKIILYTGSVSEDRGIDIILRAANILKRENYAYYFFGSTKYYVKMWEKYIKKNDIKADIHFQSVQPFKLIPYYLKAADILLATFSPNCPTLDIMSPVKIIEYMASKTPFIATKIGRNIDICQNNECLFTKVDDPIDLSEKIKLLINDKDLQTKLIQNAYEKAKNHTFKKKCNLILDFVMSGN